MTLLADTVYTLTGVNGEGARVDQALPVPLVMGASWLFDGDAPGWSLDAHTGTASVRDGALVVSASQDLDDGLPASASASLTPGDAKLQAGGYEVVEFALDFRSVFGSGLGGPRVELAYGGRSLKFSLGDVAAMRVRVVFDQATGKILVYEGSAPAQELAGESAARQACVVLSAEACSADLESEDLVLDALTITAH